MISPADIRAARQAIAGAVRVTPCAPSERLSERCSAAVYLKLENLQRTGSFKERGARNRLLQLDPRQREAGVVAASAGNHAQGVAYHARQLGIAATIVMPLPTALVKVSATRSFGARVVLHGESFDDAMAHAQQLARDEGSVLVPAFDDDAVIAGQATIGLEILEQVPDVSAVVVPVGGGGLAGGIAAAIKHERPEVRVYGVEAKAVPSMRAALDAGGPCIVPARRSLAEGIGARRVSERTFALARRYLDDVVLVEEAEIAEAILLLLEGEKTVAEGAGATPLAALLAQRLQVAGQRVVLVVSGGNIDVNLLARIIDRGLVKSGREVHLRVLSPDVPGALAHLLTTVARCQANVLEVHHDRIGAQSPIGQTEIELVLETRGFDHVAEIEAALRAAGWHIC